MIALKVRSSLVATMAIVTATIALASCGQIPAGQPQPTVTVTQTVAPSPAPSETTPSKAATTQSSSPSAVATTKAPPKATKPPANPTQPKSGEQVEFPVNPKTSYNSPWYDGKHYVQLPYGCVDIPQDWYDPDSRCPSSTKRPGQTDGFHHGADINMPIGTRIYSAVNGVVVGQDKPGAPGPAYGKNAFRIRYQQQVIENGVVMSITMDVVIGHTSEDFVKPGGHVKKGQLIAKSGKEGLTPDDPPHVHLEIRPAGGSYKTAVCPYNMIWPQKATTGSSPSYPTCAPPVTGPDNQPK